MTGPIRPGLLLFALALLIRVPCLWFGQGLWVRLESQSMRDSIEYKALAWNWAHGLGYVQDPTKPEPTGSNRAPLYPIVLSLAVPQDPEGPWTQGRLLGALLAAGVTLAAYFLARETRGPRAGLWAGALVALYPFLLMYSMLLLTETLFALFVTCVALFWVRARKTGGRMSPCFWLGISLGLGALTRPILLGVAALAGIDVAFKSRRLAPAAVLWLAFGACVMPYMIRLRLVYGDWIPITTEGGRSFYQGNNPMNKTGGAIDGKDYVYPDWVLSLGESESSKALLKEGMQYVLDHPLAFVARGCRKVIRLWSILPGPASGFGKAWMRWANALVDGPMILLALVGIWLGRNHLKQELPLAILIGYTTLFCALFTGSQRFRLPLMPLLAVWAAVAIDRIVSPPRGGETQKTVAWTHASSPLEGEE